MIWVMRFALGATLAAVGVGVVMCEINVPTTVSGYLMIALGVLAAIGLAE